MGLHFQVVSKLAEMLSRRNPEVVAQARRALDLVAEHCREWRKVVCEKKFEAHNSVWLQCVKDPATAKEAEVRGSFVHCAGRSLARHSWDAVFGCWYRAGTFVRF